MPDIVKRLIRYSFMKELISEIRSLAIIPPAHMDKALKPACKLALSVIQHAFCALVPFPDNEIKLLNPEVFGQLLEDVDAEAAGVGTHLGLEDGSGYARGPVPSHLQRQLMLEKLSSPENCGNNLESQKK